MKRGGGQISVSIDVVEAERWYAPAIVEDATPESLFERRWALSLLERVMFRLREEYADGGRKEQFNTLVEFLHQDSDDSGYREAAQRVGMSAGALRMAALRMRKKYRELLRAEIGETVTSPTDVDDEIRFLLSSLEIR